MNYEIREMIETDAASVLLIFKQGIDEGNSTFDIKVPSWDLWNSDFLQDSRLVLENENNTVIGWAALKPVSRRACFSGVAEVSIYIDIAYQGKGLGTVLLRKLILSSEENGFWTLQSGIFPENAASVAVHEKLGFRKIGCREKIGKMNGVWRDIVFLERRSKVVGV